MTKKIFFLSLCCILFACPDYEKPLKLSDFEQNKRQLVKDSSILNYFDFTDSELKIYQNSEDKKKNKSEFVIYENEISFFQKLFATFNRQFIKKILIGKQNGNFDFSKKRELNLRSLWHYSAGDAEQPLKGLKIALDPGHTASNMEQARMEGKCVMVIDKNKDTLELFESYLTFTVATILKDTLKKLGADVLITRTKLKNTAFNKTFEEWLEADFEKTLDSLKNAEKISTETANSLRYETDSAVIFHKLFKYLDIQKRVDKINDFQPHLSFIIHFNVDETNYTHKDRNGYFKPAKTNYNMVFVPGSFMKNELNSVENRIEFARLFLSEETKQSVILSKYLVENFQKKLHVKIADQNDKIAYLDRVCLKMEHGVYARNLGLTRMISGVVSYGESLCQDNEYEVRKLTSKNMNYKGEKIPRRVYEVAMAYLQTIFDYYQVNYP